jgi:hypothetical protein
MRDEYEDRLADIMPETPCDCEIVSECCYSPPSEWNPVHNPVNNGAGRCDGCGENTIFIPSEDPPSTWVHVGSSPRGYDSRDRVFLHEFECAQCGSIIETSSEKRV